MILPRMLPAPAAALAAALATLPLAAAAQSIDLRTRTIVNAGEQPSVTVIAAEPVRSVKIDLRGDRGGRVLATFGPLATGAEKTVPVRPRAAEEHYTGTVTVIGQDGGDSDTVPVELDAVVGDPLDIQVDRDRTDIAAGLVVLRLSRTAGKLDLKLLGEDGAALAEDTIALAEEPPGTPIEARFAPPAAKVARVEIVAHDKWGFFAGVALFSWRVDIPHEEVHFATDSAEIAAAEQPKLDAAHALIAREIARAQDLFRRFGGARELKLFIAGHTDTVGSRDYNRKLSGARAQSIAGWFKRKGVSVPILGAGYGEDRPLVQTADDTDEPRNRRVDYFIAVEPPAGDWRTAK